MWNYEFSIRSVELFDELNSDYILAYWQIQGFNRGLLSFLVAALFLSWLYRCLQNLSLTGTKDLLWSPSRSITWFFVPIAWWYRPVQVMAALSSGSEPATDSVEGRRINWTTIVIIAWWFTFHLGFIKSYYMIFVPFYASFISDLPPWTFFSGPSSFIDPPVIFDSWNRGGSVCLNNFRTADKWISAPVMPRPGLVAAR